MISGASVSDQAFFASFFKKENQQIKINDLLHTALHEFC